MDKLKKARERRKLSQVKLAQLAGVSQGAISNIEAGLRGGRVSTLRKLAKALGCQAGDLI